jgi:TRAP transporter TAXI family solute receptor
MMYATATAAAIGLMNCSVALSQELSMGTLTTGGSFYAVGAGLAKVVSEASPVKISVKPFGTTGSWMPLLERNQVQLGLAATEESAWAFHGKYNYPQRQKNIRLLMFGNRVQSAPLVVRKDSGINSIKDLKGKRVYFVAGNTAVQLDVQVMLASMGLTWSDVQKVPVSSTRAGADLLRENRLDATYGASATTPYSLELNRAVGIRALSYGDLDPDKGDKVTPEMNAKVSDLLPGGALAVQKAGVGFYEKSTVIIDYGLQLLTNSKLSDETAYQIVKALWTNYQKLGPIYAWLKDWKPATMFTDNPVVPYHPGAVRFYKEIGVWTSKAETNQNALLATLK